MDKNTEQCWTAFDGNLIFEFIPRDESATRVTAKIFWKGKQSDFLSLNVSEQDKTNFNKHYLGDGYVYGDFQVLAWDGKTGVNANIRYGHQGKNDEQHFDGLMVVFGAGLQPQPHHCPALLPEPCSPVTPEQDEAQADGHSTTLFPYVYVRKWPKIGEAAIALDFIRYCAASPQASSLFSALCAAREQGRAKMEQTAVDFIEGVPPYTGEYISHWSDLSGPIFFFPEIYRRLVRAENLTALEVTEIFGQRLSKVAEYLVSPAYLAEKERVWQSYFALVIVAGYDEGLLLELVETLIVCHLAESVFLVQPGGIEADAAMLHAMLHASIILPQEVFPLPPFAHSPPLCPPARGWIEPYSIGDLQMVRQRFVRYSPGEVAYIENVMRGEKKEISRRKTHRVEERRESATCDDEMLENSAGDKRGNLLEEIRKTIAEKKITQSYDNFDASYGPPTQATLSGSWVRQTDARPDADDITRFARDILNQSISRVARKVSVVRSSSVLDESEEIANSVIDNSGGEHNLICVFRWLNRVFEARVVNYGSRLILEFMLAEPAARFIHHEIIVDGFPLPRPPLPEKIGITSYQSITAENYAEFAACYRVTDITPPPPLTKFVCATLRSGEETQIAIPAGYRAANAYFESLSSGAPPSVMVGRHLIAPGNTDIGLGYGEDSTIPIAVMDDGGMQSSPPSPQEALVNVEVRCNITPTALDEWKIIMYRAIIEGYRKQLAQYLEMMREQGRTAARSAFAARRMVGKEIKRGCIELLFKKMCALRGLPEPELLQLSQPGVNEPRYLQFFDDALEWSEMSYSLYEGNMDGPAQGRDGTENSLAEFLDAKLARVLVPVRPERSMTFLYFLSSGMLWPAPDAMAPVDSSDVALVYDLKNTLREGFKEHCIGKPWQVIVPTALQIVEQANEFNFCQEENRCAISP